MLIDFANATRLIRGETYIITVPELELAQAIELKSHIEVLADDNDVKIIVLIGDEVTFTEAQCFDA